MKYISLSVLLLTAALVHAQCYRLVWSDEFDGASLDDTKWSVQIGDGCPNLCGWGNNELQYYREENLEVSSGTLKIHIREENFGGRDYTSGRIRTFEKASWTHGRIEARMKMQAGQGYWPAFWLLPEETHYGTWPLSGEIDIMEMVGASPNKVTGTIHYGQLYPGNEWLGSDYYLTAGTLDDGFHDYAVEWEEGEIRWYLDGVHYATRRPNQIEPQPWRFDRNFHIILNCAMGGWFPGEPDDSTPFPGVMEVDYVRVYQDVANTMVSGREAVLPNSSGVEYYVQPLDGATYTWTVPAGATVAAGQGTPNALIDWGTTSGEVSVELSSMACTETLNREIEVLSECASVLLDFDDNESIYRIASDGDVILSNNPGSNAINNSSLCSRYDRNPAVPFNSLRYVINSISDASLLESGALVLEMDVFTFAPAGTLISMNLEATELSWDPYPTGRHSIYEAVTTKSGEWERLRFEYQQSPDAGMGDDRVNQLNILFMPGTTASTEFWFDRVAVVDPNCATSLNDLSHSLEMSIEPNPASSMVFLTVPDSDFSGEIHDLAGRSVIQFQGVQQAGLDISQLPSGSYFIIVQTEEAVGVRQLIKP